MSLAQQVGQLFMVGTTATAAQQVTLTMIAKQHVGNVFLSGRSTLGVAATAAVVAKLRGEVNTASTDNIPLYVSTDQEGGEVQVLQGNGFSAMPTGVAQGELSPATLQTDATTWSGQLKAAGVNLNLAPVVDLVGTPSQAASNPPIGAFKRELGFSVSGVVSHADAFRAGMSASGVQTVLKHFPGLGFVNGNTDTTANVVDTVVGANGADVGIYKTEIAGGAKYIMVSSATYKLIDPKSPAVFSSSVVTGLLRGQLGFTGLIMTDDLSGAVQVKYLSPANRAIDAIEAGVDIVLVSKYPSVGPGMISAVLAKAESDPAFAAQVTAAARRVVESKAASIG
jgi:beta-N-acetylhexosaminidase